MKYTKPALEGLAINTAVLEIHDSPQPPVKARLIFRLMLRLVLMGSLWLLLGPSRGHAQLSTLPIESYWYPDDAVNAVVEANEVVYLGGVFNYVGPYTGGGGVLNVTSGARDADYPTVDGVVNTVAPDGIGGWFIGGDFISVGGLSRFGLAHIRNDKSVDPDWDPGLFGLVSSLAVAGNTVYVGGSFNSVGGQARTNLAAVDATTGTVQNWAPSPHYGRLGAGVRAIVVAGGAVYIGGSFTNVSGVTRSNLARLDAVTGVAQSWNPGVSGNVNALLISGSTIYVGGGFQRAAGTNMPYLAAIDTSTAAAKNWPTNANGRVNALALAGSTLYVAGEFTSIGGVTNRVGIAALTASSGADTGWYPGRMSPAYALAVSGSTVFVGGSFKSVLGGRMGVRLVAVDAGTGSMVPAWNTGADRTVATLAVAGTNLYAGGSFSSIGGVLRNAIAALDALTGRATTWNPDAGVTAPFTISVNALAASNNIVYVGGSFTNLGGAARSNLAAVSAGTGNSTAWAPNPNGQVLALALSNNVLFAGGLFTTIGGQNRTKLAAIGLASGAATPWTAHLSSGGVARALALLGGTLYAGGSFTTIAGQNRTNLAAVQASDGSVMAWNPSPNGLVNALAVSADAVYAGGRFTTIGGQPRTVLAALEVATGNATAWDPALAYNYSPPAVTVNGLAFASNLVFVAGLFDTVGADGHNNAAAIDPATGLASGWYPGNGLNLSATVMAVGAGRLYIGGPFSSTPNTLRSYFEAYAFDSPAPFQFTMARWEDGLFHCRLIGTDGQSYVIEATYDFSAWDWVETVTTSGGFYEFVDLNSTTFSQRFYRARVGP